MAIKTGAVLARGRRFPDASIHVMCTRVIALLNYYQEEDHKSSGPLFTIPIYTVLLYCVIHCKG